MPTRVRLFVFVTAVVAFICAISASWQLQPGDAPLLWNALVAVAVLEFLAEASYLRLRVGTAETNKSVAFIPQIASLFLFDTGWVLAIAAVAEFSVEAVVRKKPAIKIIFNVSQLVVSLALASWVFHSLEGKPSLTAFHPPLVAAGAAVLAYFILNDAAVATVVSLSDRLRFDDAWQQISGTSPLYDVISSALALLLAYLYVHYQLVGLVALIVPLLFMRHIYQVNLQLEQVNKDLLELMAKAIEARDPYTSGHSLRVSRVATQIAKERGLSGKMVEQITTAALLHDVGKIHEDFAPLLRKDAKLDATEKALMQTHPSRSAELVCTISAFHGPIEQAVRHHHENFDGSGYPLGLAGEAIPIGARVIMLADTMDAMTTDRPYRKALTFERVIEELRRFAGRQFDPALVEVVVGSAAIRDMVAARLAKEPIQVPPGALAVFARGDRPARANRIATAG